MPALPCRNPDPAEATHAAPMSAIEAVRICAEVPCLIISAMLEAASFPIIPDGIPVRGGDGAMTVPLGVFLGWEIWWGGAKAIPTAEMLGNRGTW